jgi:restriction system protein
MPKRNESILNQIALFPWWVILIFAALSFLFLNFFLPLIPLGSPMANSFVKGVSQLAPYIAIILIITSAFSLINQLFRGKMIEKQTSLDSIGDLSWRQFESLVGEVFRRKGYLVLENPSDGADGGVDLRLRRNGVLTFVQCKHWKSRSVGVTVTTTIRTTATTTLVFG